MNAASPCSSGSREGHTLSTTARKDRHSVQLAHLLALNTRPFTFPHQEATPTKSQAPEAGPPSHFGNKLSGLGGSLSCPQGRELLNLLAHHLHDRCGKEESEPVRG